MMQPLCCSTFFLLCSLVSSGLSIQCNQTQYAWPKDSPKHCCDKCQPGFHMDPRTSSSCENTCMPCTGNRFMDSYNEEMSCNVCDVCNKPNSVIESNCTTTHNIVCKCETGYMCKDNACTSCVPIPTSTEAAPTTVLKPATNSNPPPNRPLKDTAWFLVIIALLCAGITLGVLTKIKPFLHWIRSNHGFFLAEKSSSEPSSTEDEDVSKPIQEVCGKCDQPLEICIKD